MTKRYCPRSIPARIVYRMPRYSMRLSFARIWNSHKAGGGGKIIGAGRGAADCGEYRRATGNFATTLVHALGDPNSPVCGKDEVKLSLGYGVQPAADNTSARKRERMRAFAVDESKFEIAIKRRGIYSGSIP
jgi:hypothetical protein